MKVSSNGFYMSNSPYTVEISPPDLLPYRDANTGVDYVWRFDSRKPGPHVLITAIVHGNELCGAIVLDELLRAGVEPRTGILTLAFANVAAFMRFNPSHPTLSRYVDEDFNRVWSRDVLDSPRTSAELRRARELRPIVEEADYLLDLHSMQYGRTPITLCGTTEKGALLAKSLGFPEHIAADRGHAAGKRMRDYGPFADESAAPNALLVECGQHWLEETVAAAREVTYRFLTHLDTLSPEDLGVHLDVPPTAAKLIDISDPVTVKTSRFRFVEDFVGLEVIGERGTTIGFDGEEAVKTPYDDCVLLMPSRRLSPGTTAVRFGRYRA
jgi:hypothetical protein